jgi:hypothetical protein
VRCEVNGSVVIAGISAAPIPWPVYKRGKWLVRVVYRGLARVFRREAEQAVTHWWGMGLWSACRWRKALGVGPVTEGTSRLLHDHALEPGVVAGRAKAHRRMEPRRRPLPILGEYVRDDVEIQPFVAHPAPQLTEDVREHLLLCARRGEVALEEWERWAAPR